jgi:hypothetical protein
MCAVSGVGMLWLRHARENVAAVVGVNEIRSYGANKDALAFVC